MGLAVPRGGVPVANEIVKNLNINFSLIITRKLPFPNYPESGFGAIAEDGSTVILEQAAASLPENVVKEIIKEQKEEINRRIRILRGGRPLPELANKIVILVDDGIAMGSTMRASIKLCKKRNPLKLVVASPVSSPEVARAFEKSDSVDETIILEQPRYFRAVAQVYAYWRDIPDHEVISIVKEWQNNQIL